MGSTIHWYWPFLRAEDIALAESVADDRVERLVVQTLDRPGVPRRSANPRVELHNDLPEVRARRRGTPSWAVDRARTYRERHRRRDHHTGDDALLHLWFVNRFTDGRGVRALVRRRPVVVNVHDVLPHNPRLPLAAERALVGRIYRSGAHLIVHHPSLADRLVDEFGVDPELVTTIPHAVRPVASADRAAPQSDPGRHVLFFGTLRDNKGVDVLLDAISRAPADIRWSIMGRGEPHLEAAVRAATGPKVDTHVAHVDAVTKAAAFASADLVVLPYTSFSSQSGVLHDAYAHHVPVVVTDVGALGPGVTADGTGAVAPPGDADALLERVVGLLDDPRAHAEARDAAARIATDRNPARTAERLHELYARVTPQR